MDTQANKEQILAFWSALDAAKSDDIASVCRAHLAPDFIWRGPAPLSLKTGPKAVADSFWHPLKQAIPDLKREIHMIFGGQSSGRVDGGPDGENWVCGTGYLTGQARGEFLDIPATQRRLQLLCTDPGCACATSIDMLARK